MTFLVIVSVAAPVIYIGCVVFINWLCCRRGDFLSVDRIAKTLILHRLSITLRQNDIVRVVEMHGWYCSGQECSSLAELSVVARRDEGGMARYSVAVVGSSKPVSHLGERLSDFFGVERKVIRKVKQVEDQ